MGTLLYRDVWNASAEQSIKYTLKMQNGLSQPAIHYLGNYNDEWFYTLKSYIINQRYKKRAGESVYTYTYHCTTTNKWFENKLDIG